MQRGTLKVSYIRTDKIKWNPTLSASIVNPLTQTTTHKYIKSLPERRTINMAELAAITVALELYKDSSQIRILTESFFSANTLRNYAIDPLNYAHQSHKDLLRYANKTTDDQVLLTRIGVTHNDGADACARGVDDGDALP
jgi:ribonuclease HI